MQSLLERGEAHQAEFRVRRPDGEVRWCASTAAATPRRRPARSCASAASRWTSPQRKKAEERQALLAREVDHRAKNAMAIVQSIVRLTKADSKADYVSIIDGRIKALSRAHALLSNSRWQGADLGKLVNEELAPFRSTHADRIAISGPEILLEPTKAQTLALALHELAANAAKYGALSSASGKLMVRWTLEADALVIQWHETAGPETHKPSATGFGTKIITGSIERQLGGKTEFDWAPTGLRCTLTVPRGERLDAAAAPAGEARAASPPVRPIAARRVMIVEDEALVALVLADHLTEFGLSVVGPCASVAEATAAVEANDLDAAILDVNLGKELVYPVAELLVEARHPVRVRHRIRTREHRRPICPCGRAGEAGGAGFPEEYFRLRAGKHSRAAGGAECLGFVTGEVSR